MKKIIILAAVVVTGIAANAAAFNWSATRIYGPDNALLSNATASLYCDALGKDALSTASVSGGTIASTEFTVASAVAGTSYDFYFVVESGGKAFTSAAKPADAMSVGVSTVAFGNQKNATQASGAWAAVPEPTSGLMLLLGVAGLALKRKRA